MTELDSFTCVTAYLLPRPGFIAAVARCNARFGTAPLAVYADGYFPLVVASFAGAHVVIFFFSTNSVHQWNQKRLFRSHF